MGKNARRHQTVWSCTQVGGSGEGRSVAGDRSIWVGARAVSPGVDSVRGRMACYMQIKKKKAVSIIVTYMVNVQAECICKM